MTYGIYLSYEIATALSISNIPECEQRPVEYERTHALSVWDDDAPDSTGDPDYGVLTCR